MWKGRRVDFGGGGYMMGVVCAPFYRVDRKSRKRGEEGATQHPKKPLPYLTSWFSLSDYKWPERTGDEQKDLEMKAKKRLSSEEEHDILVVRWQLFHHMDMTVKGLLHFLEFLYSIIHENTRPNQYTTSSLIACFRFYTLFADLWEIVRKRFDVISWLH